MPPTRPRDRTTPSLADVASRAGVSTSTVSRALRMSPEECPLKPETQSRIQEVAAEMGYRVNPHARALRSGKTQTIGLLFEGRFPMVDSIYRDILDSFVASLDEHDHQLLMIPIDRKGRWERTIRSGAFDGFACLQRLPDEAGRALHATGLPAVLFNGDSDFVSTCVNPDDAGGVRLALATLREHGHRDIAYYAHHVYAGHVSIAARLDAFVEAMAVDAAKAGDPSPAPTLDCDPERLVAELRALPALPTALLCYSHSEAVDALRELHAAGIRVPTDISLVCFNDVFPVARLDPALTVVSIPGHQIGLAGAERLLGHINSGRRPSEPERLVLPVSLVSRESVVAALPR